MTVCVAVQHAHAKTAAADKEQKAAVEQKQAEDDSSLREQIAKLLEARAAGATREDLAAVSATVESIKAQVVEDNKAASAAQAEVANAVKALQSGQGSSDAELKRAMEGITALAASVAALQQEANGQVLEKFA